MKLQLIYSLVIILLFSACSSKITIKAIKPSVVSDKDIKDISIEKFTNDNISLAVNIESNMDKVIFNDKKYFNIVNRQNIDTILKEQKLQDSGLVNTKEHTFSGLANVSSIMTGKINSTNYSTTSFYEKRTNYNRCAEYKVSKKGKKYCSRYVKYNVRCSSYDYVVDATISITKVSNSTLIYKENYSKNLTIKSCSDDSIIVPEPTTMYERISRNIANSFVLKVAPTYTYFSATIIDDEDIDYTTAQERLLKNGLKMIELNYIKKANDIFKELVVSTKYQSSTALYNLALTEESLDNLEEALKLYEKAQKISLANDINEDIILAVIRVTKTLKDKQKAMELINE